MRILVSAIACHPERGSEAHFGWTVVRALAERHEVHVIGHGNDREAFERARLEGRISPGVRFHPLGGWNHRHRHSVVARLQNWMDYRWWNSKALPLARDLHQRFPFDLVHHVTLSSWRVPTNLWRLGIPLVWGPLGGAERFPPLLYSTLSTTSLAYEVLRSFHGVLATRFPGVVRCARRSACILASDTETSGLLARLSGDAAKVGLLSAAFFNHEQIARFGSVDGSEILRSEGAVPLRLFAGGDIEGRKGIALALRALAVLAKKRIPFHYHVGGSGPETEYLVSLARRLGISEHVVLGVPLRGRDYLQKLKASHVYLLPSLRDNAPVTLMEAMLSGCIPVVADCGGPSVIVGDDCGFRIPVADPDAMVDNLAAALMRLQADSSLRRDMSRASSNRIASSYSEEHYVRAIESCYARVTGCGD